MEYQNISREETRIDQSIDGGNPHQSQSFLSIKVGLKSISQPLIYPSTHPPPSPHSLVLYSVSSVCVVSSNASYTSTRATSPGTVSETILKEEGPKVTASIMAASWQHPYRGNM